MNHTLTLSELKAACKLLNPEVYGINAKFSICEDDEIFMSYEAKFPGYVIHADSPEGLLAELASAGKMVA